MRILFAVAALAISSPALATNAITSFTGGSVFGGFSSDETVGWSFQTSNAISVTALGWNVGAGSVASHEVGLWTTGGTLLGSVTVAAGAPTDGIWRFVSLAPITLAAGNYIIGGRDTTGDGDNYTTSVASLAMAPGISFLGAAVSTTGSGFAFPGTVTGNSGGRFGPSFQFGPAGVPEPASWAMLIAGFGIVGAVARRRRIAVAA